MSVTSFIERKLRITFQLAPGGGGSVSGQFTSSGADTVTVSGVRASARVLKAGYPSMGTMELAVWGLDPSLMNDLSTLGMKIMLVPKNLVTLEAGDDQSGYTTVFIGQIFNCWTDYTSAPDTPLRVSAQVSAGDATIVSKSLSTKTPQPAATILNTIATQLGLQFENNGVDTILPPSYFWGDLWKQAGQVAKACRIGMTVDNSTLIIWPRNGSRNGSIPLLTPGTGNVGYPSYTAEGIHLECIFNPAIAFQGNVQVQSSLPRAAGKWTVFRLSYELDAQLPDGQWKNVMDLYNPSYSAPIATGAGP